MVITVRRPFKQRFWRRLLRPQQQQQQQQGSRCCPPFRRNHRRRTSQLVDERTGWDNGNGGGCVRCARSTDGIHPYCKGRKRNRRRVSERKMPSTDAIMFDVYSRGGYPAYIFFFNYLLLGRMYNTAYAWSWSASFFHVCIVIVMYLSILLLQSQKTLKKSETTISLFRPGFYYLDVRSLKQKFRVQFFSPGLFPSIPDVRYSTYRSTASESSPDFGSSRFDLADHRYLFRRTLLAQHEFPRLALASNCDWMEQWTREARSIKQYSPGCPIS